MKQLILLLESVVTMIYEGNIILRQLIMADDSAAIIGLVYTSIAIFVTCGIMLYIKMEEEATQNHRRARRQAIAQYYLQLRSNRVSRPRRIWTRDRSQGWWQGLLLDDELCHQHLRVSDI